MDAVAHLASTVGIVAACDCLTVARASFYRQRPVLGPPASLTAEPALPAERAAPARALSEAERAAVLVVLHEDRFQDRSPAAVQAILLDEGQYLCSTRTMYRILEQEGESGERRDQLVHPAYQKPELLATAPNQLWSWDITKLRGPVKWTYFYLYVMLDLSRRGWPKSDESPFLLGGYMTRSLLHAQCLVAGQHAEGRPYAKECPLRTAEVRSTRAKKAANTRWRRQNGDSGVFRALTRV